MPVYSYSIKPEDKEAIAVVEHLKQQAKKQGLEMSRLVINGLITQYKVMVENGNIAPIGKNG